VWRRRKEDVAARQEEARKAYQRVEEAMAEAASLEPRVEEAMATLQQASVALAEREGAHPP
jgi:hypothetical protein